MPELPDVEGFRRVLAEHAAGKTIERVEVLDRSMLRNRSPQSFGRALKGATSRASPAREVAAGYGRRRLRADALGHDRPARMGPSRRERHRHDRLVFVCRGGELRYRNMRKFGGVWLARDQAERDAVTGRLGPDAQDVDREDFHALIRRQRGTVKAALMNQRLFAGVGNLLGDEVLWRAGLDPRARCAALTANRRDRLYDALREAIRESIPSGGVPHGPKWLTRVRDRRDASCPRCGATLKKGKVAARTACWCPRASGRGASCAG